MVFAVFGVFFGFFTGFCTFLFSSKLVFGFFLVVQHFWLVLRFLFNCFWCKDLGVSELMTSHLTLLFSIFHNCSSSYFLDASV